jgi:hypothetical protein
LGAQGRITTQAVRSGVNAAKPCLAGFFKNHPFFLLILQNIFLDFSQNGLYIAVSGGMHCKNAMVIDKQHLYGGKRQ